jgi:hypothetical protein
MQWICLLENPYKSGILGKGWVIFLSPSLLIQENNPAETTKTQRHKDQKKNLCVFVSLWFFPPQRNFPLPLRIIYQTMWTPGIKKR